MKSEREHIEDVKEAIARMKDAARDVQEGLRGVMAHNQGVEKAARMNAAYLTLGEFESLAGDIKQAHGRGTERLMKHFPGYEGVVVMGGGGGR